MKRLVCLSEDDIIQIIANAFNVDIDKIDYEPFKDIVIGHGKCEEFLTSIKATVDESITDRW